MSPPIEHELRALAAPPPEDFADRVVDAVRRQQRARWTTHEVLVALASFGAFAATVHSMVAWSLSQVGGA